MKLIVTLYDSFENELIFIFVCELIYIQALKKYPFFFLLFFFSFRLFFFGPPCICHLKKGDCTEILLCFILFNKN